MPRTSLAFAVPLVALLLLPSSAAAQGPYPPFYPGYPVYNFAGPEGSLRVKVKPNTAEVYVDGYFAGKVEDFDGAFQRLHVASGRHEIVVYLNGYRSLRQQLYISTDSTRTIEGSLQPLTPGDQPEAQPAPATRNEPPAQGRQQRGRSPQRQPPPPPDQPSPGAQPERNEPAANSRFGSLSVRVQPSGATVLIDDDRWDGPQGDDERLIVQVPEGRHRIQVDKEGYVPYSTDVEVARGQTQPVNVSLTRDQR